MGITQRLVHVVAGGKATGKIGKPNPNCRFRSGIFNDSDVMDMAAIILFNPCLAQTHRA